MKIKARLVHDKLTTTDLDELKEKARRLAPRYKSGVYAGAIKTKRDLKKDRKFKRELRALGWGGLIDQISTILHS